MSKPNQSGLIDGVQFYKDDPATRLFIAANYWREMAEIKDRHIAACGHEIESLKSALKNCEVKCAQHAAAIEVWQREAQSAQAEVERTEQGAIDFYEREFYPLSNFSAFRLKWKDIDFDTSEHAYHWEKFRGNENLQQKIRLARSAHDAFKYAEKFSAHRRDDWASIKTDVMYRILCEKVKQHEYVRRKLLETGERELIEMSWRDDFWGWGKNRDGKNMLGKLWMQIRAELRHAIGFMEPPK